MNEPADPSEPLPSGENPQQIPDLHPVTSKVDSLFAWGARAVYVTIMILLVAIAVPNFIKARTMPGKNACVANLKQIDGAIKQWALENKKTNADPVDMTGVVTFLKGGMFPSCPAGGVYSMGTTVGNRPTCSMAGKHPEGHSLP